MLRPYNPPPLSLGRPDVHRALRPGAGGETRRPSHVARHAVRRRVPRGLAVAGVSALGVGAGPHRSGAEPVPDAVARLDPDLAQPDHAGRVGRPVWLPLPPAQRRLARRAPLGTARRETLGARRRHSSARHAAVPGRGRAGLGLWQSVAGTVVVEGAMFVAGVWLYATATRARDRVGSYGFWALIALLALSYVGSLFSPPPPTRVALATFGIIFGWLFVAWAAWGDGHRETVVRRYDATL